MNYTVKDTRIFRVRNSTSNNSAEEEKSEKPDAKKKTIACPKLKIDFCGFRATEKPCKMEVYLHKTDLHIDSDQITGSVRMRELAREIQSRIKHIKV